MSGKSSTRTPARRSGSSRSSSGGRGGGAARGSRAGTAPAKAARPASRGGARSGGSGGAAGAAAALGRGLGRGWTMLARGVGATTRTVSRAKDIDTGHRRDGIALGLIAVAVVVAGAMWLTAAGPVGDGIETGVRWLIGTAGVVLPVVLVVVAITLFRSAPVSAARPRLVIGSILLVGAVLGVWHLFAGRPDDSAGRASATGWLGWLAGDPLARGVTVWIAVPLLVIVGLYGLLLIGAWRVGDVLSRLAVLLRGERGDEAGEEEFDGEALPGEHADADLVTERFDFDEEMAGYDPEPAPRPTSRRRPGRRAPAPDTADGDPLATAGAFGPAVGAPAAEEPTVRS